MEDQAILDLYFERLESAIVETRHKYGPRMFKTARNILHSNEDAEECVNDTLFKAWEVIPPQRPALLGAFLAKIARNLSINRWEARNADKRGGGVMNLLLSELGDCIPSAGGPEEAYEASIVTEAMNTFLKMLEQTARMVFILRYFYGESIRAISERFAMSESKVKSILFRTRRKLGIYLENEGVVI